MLQETGNFLKVKKKKDNCFIKMVWKVENCFALFLHYFPFIKEQGILSKAMEFLQTWTENEGKGKYTFKCLHNNKEMKVKGYNRQLL